MRARCSNPKGSGSMPLSNLEQGGGAEVRLTAGGSTDNVLRSPGPSSTGRCDGLFPAGREALTAESKTQGLPRLS